jgi:hypothetical protein
LRDRSQLALTSLIAFALMGGIGCGTYRDHVYRSRLIGHYVAYHKEYRTQPKSSDTLDLNDNGSCVHSYTTPAGAGRIEEPCTWTLADKVDGSWLRFEYLSNGIHRPCVGACAIEGAAWDGEFVTKFELPSTPDFMYVK